MRVPLGVCVGYPHPALPRAYRSCVFVVSNQQLPGMCDLTVFWYPAQGKTWVPEVVSSPETDREGLNSMQGWWAYTRQGTIATPNRLCSHRKNDG